MIFLRSSLEQTLSVAWAADSVRLLPEEVDRLVSPMPVCSGVHRRICSVPRMTASRQDLGRLHLSRTNCRAAWKNSTLDLRGK